MKANPSIERTRPASWIEAPISNVAPRAYRASLATSKLAAMSSIQACVLPEQALLAKYARSGAYTDCFTTEISGSVSHAEYVEAFYTGALFKLERLLLAWVVHKPSTDAQAKQLAAGALATFAAWRVEERSANQLLMCDLGSRTRSWLMVVPSGSGASAITRLYFGSAVVPTLDKRTGQAKPGIAFKGLLGFHKVYSRALLSTARSRLSRFVRTQHAPKDDGGGDRSGPN